MNNMNFVFPMVILMILTVALALTVLSSDEAKERERRETEEYEARRDRYIAWLRAQYEKPSEHQYRARPHLDFTGENELSGLTLEEIKREIVKP